MLRFTLFLVLIFGFSAQAETIEDRVDALEMKGYLEAVRFNSIFAVRTDMLDSKTDTTASQKMTVHRMYYALDGAANLTDRLDFYSRFAVTKYFNATGRSGYERDITHKLSNGRFEGADGIHLERAFFNYGILNKDLVFTAGRLPTVDGPPEELYDNLSRQGTYPAYAYGSVLDGFALTYGKNVGAHRFGIRGIYTPLTAVKYSSSTFSISKNKTGALSGEEIAAETPISSVMLEYEWTPQSSVGAVQFIGQQLGFKTLRFSDQTPRGTELAAVLANPTINPNGNGIPGTATGLVFQGSNLEVDFQSTVLSLEVLDIMQMGLNIGVTSSSTKSKSSGYLERNTNITAANATLAAALGVGKGFLTDKAEEENTGAATIVTISYMIPSSSLNEPTIGVESLSSDQYYQFFDFSGHDITSFKSTRGTATHIWWSQPIDNGFRWRIGHVTQNHKYGKGFLGTPAASTLTETTIYSNFRLDF